MPRILDERIGRIETGLLNWNKGTIGASGKLPFGGHKRSGNDRPAGISAALYCTSHQAHLENTGGFDPATLPPGMPRVLSVGRVGLDRAVAVTEVPRAAHDRAV